MIPKSTAEKVMEATNAQRAKLAFFRRWGALLAACILAACSMGGDPEVGEEPVDQQSAALVGTTTRSFQNAVAPTTAYAGTRDTYIEQAAATTTHGTSSTNRIDGDNGSGVDLSTLISWDVSSIPAGSIVREVTVTGNVTNLTNNDYQLFELRRAWSDTQATWNVASTGTTWATAGALGTADRGTTVLGTFAPRAIGSYTLTLNASGVAVVQRWVDTPSTNHGFVIANTGSADGTAFSSASATTVSQRPRLSVGYDPGGACTPTTCAAQGKNCGSISDGCGGTLACGSCISPQTCGASGVPNVCGTASAAIPTDANLKVAFIGDTATGASFQSVLQLVKSEGANMVMIQGDLGYSGAVAANWFPVIDNAINASWPGSTATVTIPYFVARGNHDTDWASYGPGLRDRMAKWGVTSENNDPTAGNYAVVHRGLKMVMVQDTETSSPSRAEYVSQRLTGDAHLWKICSWHKDQRATNVGPKSDEMGWQIYENCRTNAAIVAQGHSHTYSRSKTITNDTNQTVDGTCSDPFNLCVSPGRHIFLDSSLGGVETRTLDATWSTKPYWGSVYGASFGALFVTFNVDGDPNKARGYFKNVGGTIIDPPAASGLTSFVIRRSP